ncbi:type III toxin-antitoxin system ToxN/AbiQ family toxin [Paenibacillus pinistramenti]|uniref:type III toxin-antitoxin system ToxN/AbiQ family toxin n=1 Tax=Paenibacillus pinistramenti TaxID=1768003 RepID=UPI001107B339|nr:type III toxin-antitoxin system ToxN/AbiQ family toxin [Paenibacillus pinistramenti]
MSEIGEIEKLKFYCINDDYINFLHSHDNGVQLNVKGKLRPYIGILMELEGHKYYAPLSSYKPKFKKKNKGFFKVYDNPEEDPVAVIKFNCMIPILESELAYVNFENYSHDKKYRALLEAEYQYIKSNRSAIVASALILYESANKGRGYFYENSCKFRTLESKYKQFPKTKII